MFFAYENTTKRLFQGTLTFSSTFSFDTIFVCPGQLCLLLGNCSQVQSEPANPQFNFETSLYMIRKSQFLCIEVTKIGEKWLILLILQGYCRFLSWYIAWLLFSTRLLAKFEFPARISNKACLNLQVLCNIVHQM